MNGKRHRFAVVLAAVLLAWCGAARAGAVFFAGEMKDGQFVPNQAVKGPCYTIRYSTIRTDLADGWAVTSFRETILGPADGQVDALCVIPLPGTAEPNNATVTQQTDDGRHVHLPARWLGADEARTVYEAVARATGSTPILALAGRPALVIDRFPLGKRHELSVLYRQKLRQEHGVWSFACPMPAAAWARGPVARLSLTATVASDKPLRAMFSPSHHAAIERDGLRKARVRVKADDWAGRDDFRLCYVADEDDLGLRVLAHRPEEKEDGYFLLVGNPTGSVRRRKVLPKDVLFVLDTSGSMRGEKIEQARAAIEYCLGRLHDGDRFNIVTFGTKVQAFRDAPAAKSPNHVDAAREFVDAVVARGRTNISGALAKALAGEPLPGRLRIMIFLTDGTPTAGEIVPDRIVEKLDAMNTSKTRVFVMGVGHDVNAHLLDKLAEQTGGSSEYVDPDEDIDVKIAALYDRLSNPVLNGVTVAFGALRPTAVFPKEVRALFLGSEIMVAGRYRKGGRHTVAVSGTLAGEPVTYTCQAVFPEKTGATDNEFVAPLWAARKIGYLLREVRLQGENKELIEEIVRLSRKFGIVTEYTSFLATAGAAGKGLPDSPTAYAEVAGKLRAARARQSGQWAVNQAVNELELQQRIVATEEANVFRDRRGRVVANAYVRQVGRRAFYLRDGQWVDAQAAKGQKARRVKLFSKEYFDLLRTNEDFARAQRLGWNVEMTVGGERIAVEKEGKVRDESMKVRPAPDAQQRNVDPRARQINQLNQQQLRNAIDQIRDRRDQRRRPKPAENQPNQSK